MLIHPEPIQKIETSTIASIFRIIGNENPPRDTVGKRLEILEFILQNEPKFDNVEKWYIINRLQNIQFRRSVCELLDRYDAKYITVPLDRQAVIDATDRLDKIRCAIEINKARNLAIDHGRWHSQYVVILDGDCCFDQEGWNEVINKMAEEHQYISIPHIRSNIEIFGRSIDRSKLAEPMVAFRHDADLRFDENIPFGQGDKLHFLFNLGHDQTPGSGHCSISGDMTVLAGYVSHLSTGDESIENDTLARIDIRDKSLDKLLERIVHETPIRTGGHNTYYDKLHGFFDYSGQYSAIALDIPDNAHIVEVGSWQGKSIIYLATELKGYGKRAKIDAVDTWTGGDDTNLNVSTIRMTKELGGPDALYKKFLENVQNSGVEHMITPVRMLSIEAAKRYTDESLDFVWIDADHSYRKVLEDLNAWYPKVKIGGMFAGHDYAPQHYGSRMGVIRAVREFFRDKPLEIQPAGRAWKSVKYDANWPNLRHRKWV